MPALPAIRKIVAALQTVLATIDGVSIFIDRPEGEPFGNAELPAINILHADTRFEPRSHAETLHRASINLDMIVDVEAVSTNSARLDELEAVIIETLWANRTLGGLAEDVAPQSSEGNEQVHLDEGARLLTLEILFVTPVGDHRTIIGAAGLIP